MDVSEQEQKFIADVTQRFSVLDIEPERVTISYQADIQDYSAVVRGEVSDDQVQRIIESVDPLIYVEFEDDGSRRRYQLTQLRSDSADGRGGVVGGT